MRRRWTTPLAWGLFVASPLAWLSGFVLASDVGIDNLLLGLLFSLGFPAVGAVVAWKQPHNPLGWLFLGGTLVAEVGAVLFQVVASRQEAASVWVEYLAGTLFLTGVGLMAVFFLLLFPDGRLPSARWRWVAGLGVLGVAGNAVWTLMRPCSVVNLIGEGTGGVTCSGPVPGGFIRFDHPLGWESPGGEALWGAIGAIASVLVLAALFLGMVSLVVRYRAAAPLHRAQLRWPLAMLVPAIPGTAALVLADVAFGIDTQGASVAVFAFLLVGLPVGVGLAITRYRLYDIDRLISRTVSYALVLAVLGAMFGLLVVGPTLVLGQGTGEDGPPSWVVAGSTLAVFALFSPLRRRVQVAVDRRFDRSRYDAQRLVDGFGSRVHDLARVEEIVSGVGSMVAEALRPGSFGVWIREDTRNDPVTAA